jgi:LCP family protein required for cell wall assembly
MRRGFLNKKRILIGSIAIVAVLVAVGGFALASTIDRIKNNPLALINPHSIITDAPTASSSGTPGATAVPTQTPGGTQTADPYDALLKQAGNKKLTGTVNVLLIGVDWAEERQDNPKQYVGKYFNSDVMMLLAMHFNNQGNLDKCDMISFPRDSYARIDNMDGIYKMNFALSAGGGMTPQGYMNVCKTVQDELGGDIPVDYYIQVDMPAVKDLANAIGGVDYNVDVEFTIDGRHYNKGMQHMDGQGVLDYCRVRKGELSSGFGDLNRVNRQKNVLLAVFKKLRSTTQLADVPKIMMSLNNECHTNIPLDLLAAFAYHAKDIDFSSITMNTMPGSYAYGIFNKNYVLIDQTKRVALIQKIFNKTVAKQYQYDASYAKLEWAYMQGEAWTDAINHVLIQDSKLAVPKIVDPSLSQLIQAVDDTNSAMDQYRSLLKSSTPSVSAGQYSDLQSQVKSLQSLAKTIFAAAGYTKVNWYVNVPELMKMKE